jgi:hypothetical protein
MGLLSNIFSNKNWLSEWFHVLVERGECVEMTCGYQQSEGAAIQYLNRSHADADGVFGLAEISSSLGYPAEIKTRFDKKPPTFNKIWQAMKAHHAMSKTNLVHWKTIDKSQRGKSAGTCHRKFSRDETDQIKKFCRSNKVSLPNFLLWTINKEIAKLQKDPSDPQFWMFPVNMRNLYACNVSDENKSSFVAVKIEEKMTPNELNRHTMQQLRKNIHWGSWYGLQITGKLFGKKAFEKAYDKFCAADHSWTGSFSYLGAWPAKYDTQTDKNPDDNLFAAAIVTRFLPVGSAGVTWKGRLNIGIQLHPSLSQDIQTAENIVKGWHQNIV